MKTHILKMIFLVIYGLNKDPLVRKIAFINLALKPHKCYFFALKSVYETLQESFVRRRNKIEIFDLSFHGIMV